MNSSNPNRPQCFEWVSTAHSTVQGWNSTGSWSVSVGLPSRWCHMSNFSGKSCRATLSQMQPLKNDVIYFCKVGWPSQFARKSCQQPTNIRRQRQMAKLKQNLVIKASSFNLKGVKMILMNWLLFIPSTSAKNRLIVLQHFEWYVLWHWLEESTASNSLTTSWLPYQSTVHHCHG